MEPLVTVLSGSVRQQWVGRKSLRPATLLLGPSIEEEDSREGGLTRLQSSRVMGITAQRPGVGVGGRWRLTD